jgi:hypothetical protein
LDQFSKSIREERRQRPAQAPDSDDPLAIPLVIDDDDDSGWKASKFECPLEKRRRLQEAVMEQKKAMEDYVLIDPRQERASGSKEEKSRNRS